MDSTRADSSGTMAFRLQTIVDGTTYVLSRCELEIKGPVRMVMRPADKPKAEMSAELPVGDYVALLRDGWEMYTLEPSGARQKVSDVKLLSKNPANFAIQAQATTTVGFSFEVNGSTVEFPVGKVKVQVDVKKGKGCTMQDDVDKDGVPDCHDACPNDPNKWQPGACGCGKVDEDLNNNAVTDCLETQCKEGNLDTDKDGVADCVDTCPLVSNPEQTDTDKDGRGDACPRGKRRPLSSTGNFSCAIRKKKVYCWGNDTNGRLGIGGKKTQKHAPERATGEMSKVVSLAVGQLHSCAIEGAGEVWCWGHGSYGELGNGEMLDTKVPVKVQGIQDAVDVAVGAGVSCVLHRSGGVSCWGMSDGLGRDTEKNSDVPLAVPGLENVVQIAAGGDVVCALKHGGDTYCWGRGPAKMGQSTTPDVDPDFEWIKKPTRGDLLPKLVAVEVMADSVTCGIRATPERQVLCWGGVTTSYLGHGPQGSSAQPVQVQGLQGVRSLGVGGSNHSCAVLLDGSLRCWGAGALGNEPDQDGWGSISGTPVQTVNMKSALWVAHGEFQTCAFLADGQVQCWGNRQGGYLGFDIVGDTRSSRAAPAEFVQLPEG